MSLQDLCKLNIANSIYNMPPHLQESLIHDTKAMMKEKAEKEVTVEMVEKVKNTVYTQELNILPELITEISEDIISCITRPNKVRQDFYRMYPFVDKTLVNIAIQTAERITNSLEDRYIHSAFNGQQFYSYGGDDLGDDTEEDSDNYNMYNDDD